MRKYNSSFKTAFISEEGSKLRNNDYFGFVEMDNYACYVIADGITDIRDSQGAKRAIEAVINAFLLAPGIRKRKIKTYLRLANRELLTGESYEKLKASIIVVVTDYEKFRYGHAGNARLRLYRNGRKILASADMSLGQDMVRAELLTEDKLAKHEERNNLLTYLGKEKFTPFISKKIRLVNGDIIALYTKGIWENLDEGELADVFAEAGNEPAEECDQIEDLLLSRQPVNLDNYTFAAIYIDKIYIDPNRKKRIRKIVVIVLVIFILVLVIGVILYLWRRGRTQKRERMQECFSNTETYIEDNNFIRAEEECKKALELAQDLHDRETEEHYKHYLVCLEAVIRADDYFTEGNYTEAKEAYLTARARVRFADNQGVEYIEGRLLQISGYEQIFDDIALGDSLLELGSYELAEEKYLEAKMTAASIYFTEGRQQALDALEQLYEVWGAEQEEQEQQSAMQAADEAAAAGLVRQGNEAYSAGDYDGAMVFYLIALQKYTELEDHQQIDSLNQQIIALNEKQQEVESQMESARELEELARIYEEEKNYLQAKIEYQYAKAIYLELGKDAMAEAVQGRIDILDTKIVQEDAARREIMEEEEKTEMPEPEPEAETL